MSLQTIKRNKNHQNTVHPALLSQDYINYGFYLFVVAHSPHQKFRLIFQDNVKMGIAKHVKIDKFENNIKYC